MGKFQSALPTMMGEFVICTFDLQKSDCSYLYLLNIYDCNFSTCNFRRNFNPKQHLIGSLSVFTELLAFTYASKDQLIESSILTPLLICTFQPADQMKNSC